MNTAPSPPLIADPNLLAALDIGSNSIRLSVVRLDDASQNWTTTAQYKETVRLGEGEFEQHELTEAAMQRGIATLKTFAEIARGYGCGEIVAIGTAALREAENRAEFVRRVRDETGIEIRIVSGVEEARLIYLGVVSGLELGGKAGLFIDIGGGSTELIVGTQTEHKLLDSLKLGAIRVANHFLQNHVGPVAPDQFTEIQQYVRSVASHTIRRIQETGFDLAIASSGTATNLAKIAMARQGIDPATLTQYLLPTVELSAISRALCRMTQEERRSVPGLNPERADIIVAGAAVLLTLAEDLGVSGFRIADRSLREGVLVDALLRRSGASSVFEAGVRRRSVERLLRLVEGEATHARHVAQLTMQLFDQTREAGLHSYGSSERELLGYAALLHDIGVFVARSGHHRHSFYIIRNAEMVGFTDEEVQVIANLAYFHRKSPPKKRHEHFQNLSPENQNLVRQLSTLLRLAEGLDRSHRSVVPTLRFSSIGRKAQLTVMVTGDARLELYYVSEEIRLFEEVFDVMLTVIVQETPSGQIRFMDNR